MGYKATREKELIRQFESLEEMRSTVIFEASEPLKKKIQWIQNWFKEDNKRTIKSRYELGCQVKEIYDDEQRRSGKRYGSNAVKIMERYFDWDESTIYGALALARAYTPGEIERISTLATAEGEPVCCRHLINLARVKDRAEREELLQKSLKETWTVKEIADAVNKAVKEEGSKAETRGRPLAVPKTLNAVIGQQANFAADFHNRTEKVWRHPEHSLAYHAHQLSSDEIDEARVQQLAEHARKMKELAREAQERADEATEVYERVKRVLEKRNASEAGLKIYEEDGKEVG